MSCGPLPPGSGFGESRDPPAPNGSATLPAFPGAEGFGAAATGGRGGRVIKVTTLAARGRGSLAEALAAKGKRTIVFDVSGVIDAGLLEIPHGNLTIAGQTAPGAGITIRGRLYAAYRSGVDNIIIRHIPENFSGKVGNPWLSPLVHPAFEYLELEEDGSSVKFRSAEAFAIGSETDSPHFAVTTQPSQQAYELVLNRAGAFPRDVVTRRDVEETRARTGTWGARIPADLMDGLEATEPPVDLDGDGMPDLWETARNLDPADGSDHRRLMPSGYTAIETYINERADELVSSP
ncbi:MAG: hypothetical protein GY811_30195 [Myxococcales bacterium]|nr:hypothetical protein [Myxococcales bacterium]